MTCKPVVLVVEDEVSIREVTAATLAFGGYQVEAVSNGAEALVWLQDHWPAALVLDLRMWPVGGVELLETLLLQHGRVPPVVIVSAYVAATATDAVTQAALRFAPAAAVLSKPFDIDDLDAALRQVLGRRAP